MGSALQILTISSISTVFLVTLFSVEQYRGRRYGESVRAIFDRMIMGIARALRSRFPEINSLFFQEFAYYILHVFLSKILMSVRRIENGVHSIVRFNRMKALKLRARTNDESTVAFVPSANEAHLSAVAEHKKETELSPKEKPVESSRIQ